MSTPRFYCWDDDGSPGRALTGNLQNKLKQILVPCLVTGYGDKPGAGWTIGHEHANGFSLINADGNVVNFVSDLPAKAPLPAMDSRVIHIYAAESLTDTSNAIIGGASLCSGTFRKDFADPSPFTRHMLGYAVGLLTENLSTLIWVLVADDKSFTLNCSVIQSLSHPKDFSFSLYCGEVALDSEVSGNFLVLGGNTAPYNSVINMAAFSRGYSAPTNLATGLAETVPVGSEPYQSSYDLFPTKNATNPPAKLNLQQPRLLYGDSFVGRLRGVVYDDVLRGTYGWAAHLKALGFSGTDFTDRGKLALIDGYSYAFAFSNSGSSFLTDNPAFW